MEIVLCNILKNLYFKWTGNDQAWMTFNTINSLTHQTKLTQEEWPIIKLLKSIFQVIKLRSWMRIPISVKGTPYKNIF